MYCNQCYGKKRDSLGVTCATCKGKGELPDSMELPAIMLHVGESYRDGRGHKVDIAGVVKGRSEYFWSLQGSWYERTTGRFVYCRNTAAGSEGYYYTTPDSPDNVAKREVEIAATLWGAIPVGG